VIPKLAQFVVTAGHSSSDPGAVAPDGRREADLAVVLRDVVVTKLRERGFKVLTDGEWRQNSPLQAALRLIDKAPIAIEIHFNASDNPAARGVECISLPKLRILSQHLSTGIAAVLESKTRGAGGWIDQRQSARGRLAFVEAGGIIVETCFLTSPQDMKAYDAKLYLVANAIVRELVLHAQTSV
jgi:N-acetylmuramoyl-L-alanine amidase